MMRNLSAALFVVLQTAAANAVACKACDNLRRRLAPAAPAWGKITDMLW
ncbi:hypothetical protein A4U88_0470 [Serratia marcescens]|nr:hypothetical protein A4U88_0470 [Serratia marcescens]